MQEAATAEVEVSDTSLLMGLIGTDDERLARLRRGLSAQVGVRGSVVHLQGDADAVAHGERVIIELVEALHSGVKLHDSDVESAISLLREHPELHLRDIMAPVKIGPSSKVSPRGLAQRHYVQTIRDHDIVFGIGPAGTGKTYLAMAMAVAALLENRVKRIILTRPAVEAGEKLGFLPGDLSEKVDPYLRPLYDALFDMMPTERAQLLMERGTIEVAPLAFMRGRTLNDSFVILDEAQNTKVSQMRMFLTRIGMRSKAVITGDTTQLDLPTGVRSGLDDATRLLGRVPGIGVCTFSAADVVRHPLVQRIVEAYDERDAVRAHQTAAGVEPRR